MFREISLARIPRGVKASEVEENFGSLARVEHEPL